MIVLLVIVVAVLVYAATRPNSFRYQRSTSINTRAETVFAQISDLHCWEAWSPWEEKDPAMRKTYSGADAGPGAVYEWSGNKQVGQGRIELVDVTEPSRIGYRLDFIKPFKAQNYGEFLLEVEGDTTRLTWIMTGHNNFMSKLFGLFFDFDLMIGKDFELGLAKLKALIERH